MCVLGIIKLIDRNPNQLIEKGVFRNPAFENPENRFGAEDNFGTAIFRNFFQPGERLPCPRDAERNGGGTCQCAAKKCLYEVKPLGKKQKHIPTTSSPLEQLCGDSGRSQIEFKVGNGNCVPVILEKCVGRSIGLYRDMRGKNLAKNRVG